MKRKYNSLNRRRKAAETRETIAQAAKALFARRGFESATLEEIAEKAGVPLPTVYGLFKSKKGILKEVMERAMFGREYATLVQQTKEIAHPEERLRGVAKITRSVYDTEREEMNLLRGAVVVAPEFAELEREREQRRFERQLVNLKLLAAAKALRKDLTVGTARDVLWALTGREPYRLLVIEKKWSPDQYEKWLGDLLIQALLKKKKNSSRSPLLSA
ncbi:MAG TPA: TetR/AcrR family transcriptional regulator [Candidatus Acidoferrales bacterium]|nr:TetR/AcrR family transcriptional regulator [Candidatus Acidoferrales bacterium]